MEGCVLRKKEDMVSLHLLACGVLGPASTASLRKSVFKSYHKKGGLLLLLAFSYCHILPRTPNTANGGLPFLLPALALLNSTDSSDPLILGTCSEQGSRKGARVQPVHCCIKLLSVLLDDCLGNNLAFLSTA